MFIHKSEAVFCSVHRIHHTCEQRQSVIAQHREDKRPVADEIYHILGRRRCTVIPHFGIRGGCNAFLVDLHRHCLFCLVQPYRLRKVDRKGGEIRSIGRKNICNAKIRQSPGQIQL